MGYEVSTLVQQRQKQLTKYNNPKSRRENVPVTGTAAPGNSAEAGGAISKPLILLLQVVNVSI